jgi:hypothetical protein
LISHFLVSFSCRNSFLSDISYLRSSFICLKASFSSNSSSYESSSDLLWKSPSEELYAPDVIVFIVLERPGGPTFCMLLLPADVIISLSPPLFFYCRIIISTSLSLPIHTISLRIILLPCTIVGSSSVAGNLYTFLFSNSSSFSWLKPVSTL